MAVIKTAASTIEQTGSLVGKKFSLDQASSDHIIGLLAHAYSKPVFSSFREALQNALDADPSKKIHVWLPTAIDPMVRVRDTGPGMNAETLERMIGTVGASDKRGDAKRAGGLGIGSIAPMCIAETMTITSFQNGTQVTLNVFKNDDGSLGYAMTEATKTREPDGVLVAFPLPADMHRQAEEALDAFKLSKDLADRIILGNDGYNSSLKAYSVLSSDTVKVGAHDVEFRLVEGSSNLFTGAVILMNGIPMGADASRFPELIEFSSYLASTDGATQRRRSSYSTTSLVIVVPPEAGLSFPPSREVIAVTRLNSAFLKNAVLRFFEAKTKDLESNGLSIGCEGAACLYWRKRSAELGLNLRQSLDKVREELNAMGDKDTDYLRAELILGYDYNVRGEAPTAALHPRLPASCEPRSLDVRSINESLTRRGAAREARIAIQTCGCIPIDTNKPELGFKYPFPVNAKVALVTWDKLPEFDGDWGKAHGSDVKIKQALYEVARPLANSRNQRNVLLLSKPLPSDHPMMKSANSTQVTLQSILDGIDGDGGERDNPFHASKFETNEDEEREEKGTKTRTRMTHPRTWLRTSGSFQKCGLPKGEPFAYLTWVRGVFEGANSSDLATSPTSRASEGFIGWLKLFEEAGIADGIEVALLTSGEATRIKRPHVKLLDLLTERVKAWVSLLTPAELADLPYGIFRTVLKAHAPKLLSAFKAMNDLDLGEYDPNLKKFLRICKAPASQNVERLYNALDATFARKSRYTYDTHSAEVFAHVMDTRNVDAENKLSTFGFSNRLLLQPIKRLRKWLKTDTDLVLWIKMLMKTMNSVDAKFQANFAQAAWSDLDQDSVIDDATKIASIAKKLV
jgi:hypothetical protein